MNEQIIMAIEKHRLLKLAYSAGNRVVEPHVYGTDREGKELLRCYQIGGESISRERYGWKMLREPDIGEVEVLDVPFVPRPGYNPDDPVIHVVHARVPAFAEQA